MLDLDISIRHVFSSLETGGSRISGDGGSNLERGFVFEHIHCAISQHFPMNRSSIQQVTALLDIHDLVSISATHVPCLCEVRCTKERWLLFSDICKVKAVTLCPFSFTPFRRDSVLILLWPMHTS